MYHIIPIYDPSVPCHLNVGRVRERGTQRGARGASGGGGAAAVPRGGDALSERRAHLRCRGRPRATVIPSG